MSTSLFPFYRFTQLVQSLADEYHDQIILQYGYSKEPIRTDLITPVDFLSIGDFEKKCMEASLVISQAGIGVVISCLSAGTPLVLVPRLSVYGETETDHQLEMQMIVSNLDATDQIKVVIDEKQFGTICKSLYGKRFQRRGEGELPKRLVEYITCHCQ